MVGLRIFLEISGSTNYLAYVSSKELSFNRHLIMLSILKTLGGDTPTSQRKLHDP